MFNRKLLPAALATTLLAGASAAQAQIEANVTIATDYLFRGISQTGEKGAIQGGFDYGHETGLYVGIWASNVNYASYPCSYGPGLFCSETSTEMDYYVGFAGETDGGFGYDVSYIYFDYEGDAEFDYQEFAVGFSYADFSIGVNYSDEYLGEGGPEMFYPYAGYSLGLTDAFSVDFHIGYTTTDADDFWEPGEDSYADYSITLGYSIWDVDLALAAAGTSLDLNPAADDRLVFSISKSL